MNDTLKKIAEMKEMANKMNAKLDDMIRTLKVRKIMRSDKLTQSVKSDLIDVLRSLAKSQ